MYSTYSISISDVVDILDLKRDPRSLPGAPSYYVKCPFCDDPGDRKYHMNISESKNVYRCVRCSGNDRNLGVLDLYSRVRFGIPAKQKGAGDVFRALMKELKLDIRNRADFKFKSSACRVIRPAKDEILNETYSALLSLPYLELSDEHRVNLLKRGMNIMSVVKNGYGTLNTGEWVKKHPYYKDALRILSSPDIEKNLDKYPKLGRLSRNTLAAGILISHDLQEKGVSLLHVPGFFRLTEDVWCMKVDNGMMIPTRNIRGEIVGLQIRTDKDYKKGLRYITLSSKDFDCGPNTDISRVHFPLGNTPVEETETIALTEGPLKADIAVSLSAKRVFCMAVQGVSNTRELPDIADILKKKGADTVCNMLDMDRFVNVHVQKAADAIGKLFAEKGISFSSCIWDSRTFNGIMQGIRTVCDSHDITVPQMKRNHEDEWAESIFRLFSDSGTNLPEEYFRITGHLFEWPAETKGIDDFLKKEKETFERRKLNFFC